MKRARPNDLGLAVEKFFREYLPTLRGMSLHTIRSYRDALILFLRFVSSHSDQRLEDLCLDAFTAEHVTQFLMSLEVERHNSIATRNARLAALHTFARFLAAESPEHLAKWQRVLGLPFKRGARNAPIDYLESTEAETLLGQIDRSTETGRRDYALFALMLNTGAPNAAAHQRRHPGARRDVAGRYAASGRFARLGTCGLSSVFLMAAATPRLPALPRVKIFRNSGWSLLNPVDEVGRARIDAQALDALNDDHWARLGIRIRAADAASITLREVRVAYR
jgi:hypothetical protein